MGEVTVKFCEQDAYPGIGGYRRAKAIAWKDKTPHQSVVTFVNGEPASALRTFLLTLGQPDKVRRVSGVSIQERQPPISVIGIGALGTRKGFDGKGYMSAALDFLIKEHGTSTNGIVALTRRPNGGLWTKHGFVFTKSQGINGNSLVAKSFNERLDPNIAWKVPFHF